MTDHVQITERDAVEILRIAEGQGTENTWADGLVARLARGWLDKSRRLNSLVKAAEAYQEHADNNDGVPHSSHCEVMDCGDTRLPCLEHTSLMWALTEAQS